jgi:hypothetical protein
VRISISNDNRLGIVNSDRIHDVTSVLDAVPARRYPLCADDGVYELFFTAPPIHLSGGAGSPFNPHAK